jgi:chromosome partitioning protein
VAKIIAIANQKGGASGLGVDRDSVDKSIYDVLIGAMTLSEVIRPTELNFLHVVPSAMSLVGAEVELVSMMSRETRLRTSLEGMAGEYEYIIVDCPPSLGLLTINTLTAADSVIIPIQCEYYALEGLGQLMNTVKLIQQHLNPDLKVEGVLLTMHDSRLNLSRQVSEEVRRHFDSRVYETVIARNVRLSEAPSFGKPIILYDILSTGAENYMSLTKEVMAS